MKKALLVFAGILIVFVLHAQVVSFSKSPAPAARDKAIKKSEVDSIKLIIADTLQPAEIIRKLSGEIDSVLHLYYQKRLMVLSQGALKNKAELVAGINAQRDSIVAERKARIRKIEYWDKYDRIEEIHNERSSNKYQWRNFFPAFYSSQAVRFFESDTVHQKLFQNNLVNYSPKTKKMILYTEAVNDYIGPLRVGIGFQIESESKTDSLGTPDSTQKAAKQADMIAALQNGGGDFSVNIKMPLIKTSNPDALIQSKFNFYANSGFSLPVLNKASDDFLFNYDAGIEGAFYAAGFNGRLTFYSQLKAGYYNGNKNYKKIITDANKDDPTSFFLMQSSFGLDFLDGYRIRVDLFHGSSFIKKNFPATITFVVRPGKKKEGD